MIAVTEYAKKYSIHRSTVWRWIKEGKIASIKKKHGETLVDDTPPHAPPKGRGRGGAAKFCGLCKTWKSVACYSPSRRDRPGGLCRDCSAHVERKRRGRGNSPESLSYEREMVAQQERLEDIENGRLHERERRIIGHMIRVAMGKP